MLHKFPNLAATLKDIGEGWAVALSSIALHLNIGFVIDYFTIADGFFEQTQNLWKNIPFILASLYTLLKMYYDVSTRIRNRRNDRNKPKLK